MSSELKYYHPYASLTGAYGNPVGYDCAPVSITIEIYGDKQIEIKYPFDEEAIVSDMKDFATKNFYSMGIRKIICDTGLVQEPSKDIWIMACANSRITKTDLVLQNGLGIIDPDYRGTIKFVYHTVVPSFDTSWLSTLTKSCGQLIAIPRVKKLSLVKVDDVNELTKTDRGTGGFGSSVETNSQN